MKKIIFHFQEGIRDLYKNKGRSFLTSLGIIIGVFSVVLLLSLGEGLRLYISNQFESLGSNLIYILPGKISSGGASLLGGKKYTFRDYLKLKSGLINSIVVPITTKNVTVVATNKDESTSVLGATREIFTVRNLNLQKGRYYSKNEEVGGRKVVLIGPKIAEKLFRYVNPVGQTVKIQGLRFLVIGVLEPKGGGGFGGPDLDNFLYIPYKAIWSITGDKSFASFYIKPERKEAIPLVVEKANKIMLKTYKVDDFSISTQKELISTISSIFSVINLMLVGIAAISLLVGGIGITNIMYVVITERTREIGIRRAIGATQKDILFQFLIQSVLLTTLGGLMAILLAYIVVFFVYPIFPATITIGSLFLAFFVSFFIGTIFGVFPAIKAARLSPVEAIRYE